MSARAGRPRKTAETPVKAVEEVKENVKEDVKEAVEAVKTAGDEVKEEIKTEVKEEVKKTPARRGRKSAAEKPRLQVFSACFCQIFCHPWMSSLLSVRFHCIA